MKTRDDIYFNFMLNLLVGSDLQAVDRFLSEYFTDITEAKEVLLDKIDYKPKPIYRGVIMHEYDLQELPPHPNMKCLSFTEDISIAKIFADPTHWMALNFSVNDHGYIIERMPCREEILFHHEFLNLFPYYNNCLVAFGIDGSTMPIQKEVTILQPNEPLQIKSSKQFLKTI